MFTWCPANAAVEVIWWSWPALILFGADSPGYSLKGCCRIPLLKWNILILIFLKDFSYAWARIVLLLAYLDVPAIQGW